MKRRVFLLVAAALLCIAAAAFATELTWDQACTQKTSSATMLYVLIPGDESLTATSMLPGGTYIRTTGQSMEGMTGISYSANNCDPLYGYIDGSVIVSAAQTVTLPSGRTVTVGEALVRSRTALNLWLEMEYGETLDSGTYTDENGVEHEIGNEAALEDSSGFNGDAVWAKNMGIAGVKNGYYTSTFYRDGAGNETPVQVVYMGLARSMVLLNGEERLVETWQLSWETEAPEDQVLAVVRPDQGQVSVYPEPKKGTRIDKVGTNKVLRVISVSKNWALVDINSDECPRGYVMTGCLEFYPNIPMIYRPAKLSVLGKLKGDTVNIRSEDTANGRIIDTFDTGTPVSVYAQNDKWSEVDVGGYHAFVLSEFVTMDDPAVEDATADAAPGE